MIKPHKSNGLTFFIESTVDTHSSNRVTAVFAQRVLCAHTTTGEVMQWSSMSPSGESVTEQPLFTADNLTFWQERHRGNL